MSELIDGPEVPAHSFDPAFELRDIHEADRYLSRELARTRSVRQASRLERELVRAKTVKKIPGGVTVRDYRGTGLCPPNGGRIDPQVFVQHIPVIRNVPGTGDIIVLADVLKAQRLAIQTATDAEGNVAIYSSLNRLCFHARGANFVSCGCEHMHYSTTERWTERQMRAAAYLAVRAEKTVGIPYSGGTLGRGAGVVVVRKTGHVSHKRVSAAAGFNDRSDPGSSFNWKHFYDLCRFFDKKGRF